MMKKGIENYRRSASGRIFFFAIRFVTGEHDK